MKKNHKKKSVVPYRNVASFGKRMEYWIIGRMLKERLDIYMPLVDDDAIDAVVRKPDGSFVTVQIKARSKDCRYVAYFQSTCDKTRDNYWFIFYSEYLNKTWIMTSEEFLKESSGNKTGANLNRRGVRFNRTKKGVPYCDEKYDKYLAEDFHRLKE